MIKTTKDYELALKRVVDLKVEAKHEASKYMELLQLIQVIHEYEDETYSEGISA